MIPLPMTPETCLQQVIKPGLGELPSEMHGQRAQAMILAIMMQESDLSARRQHNNGPAAGLAQFERGGGIRGVLKFGGKTSREANAALARRRIAPTNQAVWEALQVDDQLAAIFSRLLLWTDPASLPDSSKPQTALAIYLRVWRPGAYHNGTQSARNKLAEKFVNNFAKAWSCVAAQS